MPVDETACCWRAWVCGKPSVREPAVDGPRYCCCHADSLVLCPSVRAVMFRRCCLALRSTQPKLKFTCSFPTLSINCRWFSCARTALCEAVAGVSMRASPSLRPFKRVDLTGTKYLRLACPVVLDCPRVRLYSDFIDAADPRVTSPNMLLDSDRASSQLDHRPDPTN